MQESKGGWSSEVEEIRSINKLREKNYVWSIVMLRNTVFSYDSLEDGKAKKKVHF